MSEDYWDRRRRHLNEDHEFRRAQSKRDIEILKGKHHIDEGKDAIDRLAAESSRRERSEKLKALVDEMQKERAFVLERIAACSSVHKDQWSEQLSGIDLTQPSADAELNKLHEEVEGVRRLWGDKPFSEFTYKSRPPSSPDAIELRWQQEQQEREQQRKLMEGDLALIVSSLGVLISTRNLYEAT
jgi:hypothetical protein